MHTNEPIPPGSAEPQLRKVVQKAACPPGSAEPQLRNVVPTDNAFLLSIAQEWHSRGYLPHRDRIGLLQAITFRLADSLPQEKLRELKEERESRLIAELGLRAPREHPQETVDERKKIEAWLDAGMGCCALRHPQMAQVMQETLLTFDSNKYRLLAWCIMPNHVHVLIEPLIEMKRIVQSWKSYTGRWAMSHNAQMSLRIPGDALWQPDYWDRYIRDSKHLHNTIDYIRNNPVKASLCTTPEDWPWGSARMINPGMKTQS